LLKPKPNLSYSTGLIAVRTPDRHGSPHQQDEHHEQDEAQEDILG